MQEHRLIAVDMDGTFLNDKMDYDRERFARIYPQLLDQGTRFVVASGNQFYQLRSFFQDYPDVVYLSENGALIRDDEQIYFESAFKKEDAAKIARVLSSYPDVEWLASGVKSAYTLRTNDEAYLQDSRKYYYRLELIDDFDEIDDDIVKFSTHCPANETAEYVATYAKVFAGIATPTSSGHGDIDIIQPGIHKARGLSELGKVLGVPASAMITFGNGGNDIEMLQYAGTGVAVSNSPQDVLDAADVVTESNNAQGVLSYIEQNLL
ncbi:Cof-type HAD-IIB family hydrolase [Lacticaseibacillus pabuli]|uniref:Cof-type HAD-IIB family hydrolase n=1 Tax=Lacticaseibacillus pabuli TaxID=3025672 RepID=A0ABY7WRN5_9LACO|nr:Cof-type HAD-IIB family hydrolase [Lacticaseibacillus sp. KACC 23028]WDF82847.1 Cof-type HAD-IIB family hydrolase [Lacticaseibacillus sp. KACC 23028]